LGSKKEEGRRKKEEGRGKKEEGTREKEEGRRNIRRLKLLLSKLNSQGKS